MIGDERLKSSEMKDATGRKNNEPLIDFCISEWAIRMERDRVMKLLQANNIAAASVQNNLEVFEDEHLNYRNFFTQLTEKYYGQQTYDGQSMPGNKKPKKEWFPMKELGEDTDQIVNHLLGLKPQKAEISKDAK